MNNRRIRLLEFIARVDLCKCDICQKQKRQLEQKLIEMETPMYDKMIFSSKEAEEEWNNAPEDVKKMRDKLLSESISQTQARIQREMEEKIFKDQEQNDLAFWKKQSGLYEWLFIEQKDISAGYRKIIEEQEKIINDLKLNK